MKTRLLIPLLSLLLLTACGSAPAADAPPQVTELQAGHQTTNANVQLLGELSPEQGRYLTLQVENVGEYPVLLFADRNLEDKVRIEPGQTGTLQKEVGLLTRSYYFSISPPGTGGDPNVIYTLTQSTTPPTPS